MLACSSPTKNKGTITVYKQSNDWDEEGFMGRMFMAQNYQETWVPPLKPKKRIAIRRLKSRSTGAPWRPQREM
uniref:Uncharacterized protein n=1 Tax=Oryza meridionalis TaxID=40149 RepID=A0A0E0DRL0_9ORYZ